MPPHLLSKLSWKKIKWASRIILAALIFLTIFYIGEVFLSVKNIEVYGISNNYSLIGLDSYKNKSLIFLSEKELIETLKNQNPQIKKITVAKKFPQKLMIFTELYQPAALIKTNDGYWHLSSDGRILFKSRQKNPYLPLINYYQLMNQYSFNVGDWLTYKDLIMALKFLSALTEIGLPVDSIDIAGYDMIVFKIGEKQIFFTSQKKEEEQKYTLKVIIRQFKIEGKEFKSLDLRFEKPIIKF